VAVCLLFALPLDNLCLV